jgi:hypothetical protein
VFHLGDVIQASTQAVISAVRAPARAAARLRLVAGEQREPMLTNS